jgi:hypothetical protein
MISAKLFGAGKTEHHHVCGYVRVKFRSYRDAVLFKMFFGDDICNLVSVLPPMMRRVMPTVIASKITGVSPMCAPNPKYFPKLDKAGRRKRNKLRQQFIQKFNEVG